MTTKSSLFEGCLKDAHLIWLLNSDDDCIGEFKAKEVHAEINALREDREKAEKIIAGMKPAYETYAEGWQDRGGENSAVFNEVQDRMITAEQEVKRLRDALEYCSRDDSMAVTPDGKLDVGSANEWKKMKALETLGIIGQSTQAAGDSE